LIIKPRQKKAGMGDHAGLLDFESGAAALASAGAASVSCGT
jgi:hypothetical protein